MKTTLNFKENGKLIAAPQKFDYKQVDDFISQINDYIINVLVFEDFEDFNVKSRFFELWCAKDLKTKQAFARLILEQDFFDEEDLFKSYDGDISHDLTNITYMLHLLLSIAENDTDTSWEVDINYIDETYLPSVEVRRLV